MPKEFKYTDQQILAVLKDPSYKSNRQRAIALGTLPNGGMNRRINEVREKYGLPEPEPSKIGRPAKKKEDMGILKYEEIKKDDRLIHDKKRLIVLAIDSQEMTLKRMTGSTFVLSRKRFDAMAKDFKKLPTGDPQGGPVTTYYIPPGTEVGDINIAGTAIKDLPDEDKQGIISHFVSGGPKPGEIPQPGGGGEGWGTVVKRQVPLFSEEDYIDPEWGVIERAAEEMIPGGRSYMDKINQLLDIMVVECREDPLMKLAAMTIAKNMLERGFAEEIAHER